VPGLSTDMPTLPAYSGSTAVGDVDRTAWAVRASWLPGGYAVLMISLRCHGDSTGNYHDVGYRARYDIHAPVAFLEARRPGRPVIVIGNSMGAAAAIFAANELGNRVHGYVLESPYQDLKVAVWNGLAGMSPVQTDWAWQDGSRAGLSNVVSQ
jgi:alpha-beta hydrolase superfamily lysophospholipase